MTLLEFVLAIIASNSATVIITSWLNRRKTAEEIRKTSAEADHTYLDVAADAIAMTKGAHGERILELERQVKELKGEREIDRQQLVSLNRLSSELRLAAELQSKNILSLNDEVCLWRSRVSELLCILREKGIPLPSWSEGA